jgi:methyl-accepting chemotaxis protein
VVGVRGRLFGSFAVIIVLVACAVGVGLWGVQSLHQQGRVVAEQTTPYLTHLSDAAVAAKAAANDERGFLLTSDQSYITEFDGRIPTVQGALAAAGGSASNAAQRSAIADVATGFQSWVTLVHAEFTLHATDPGKALGLALGANRDARKAYESSIAVATKQAQAAIAASVVAQDSAASAAQRVLIGVLAVAVAGAMVIAVKMARQVTVPLREMQGLLTAAAGGDLTGRATGRSRDEFGVLARAFNAMLDSVSAVMSTIARNAASLAAATEELTVSSSQISVCAEESSAQATVVAAAAEQVSVNVQTVAASTEEMSASIREIAKNTNDAAGVAAQAVQVAQTANTTVAKLGTSSAEISTVVKVINSIAAQTNLLALNATIEAARAGEAGKGFAVVAGEVKELAQETSRATEDIGRRIDAIQSDTQAAVAAIAQISGIIEQINDTQATIASAVEEQTATTNEMSRNVTEAADGSSEIAANITGVATAAAATTEGVAQTLAANAELSRMSTELTDMVSRFTYSQQVDDDTAGASSLEAKITKAIGAHGAWKKRLSAAITNKAHGEDATAVARDDQCDFGRWLHGSAPEPRDQAYHQASTTLHANFHVEAAKTLRLISAGQQAQASAAIAIGGDFAEASRLLTKTMIEWRQSTASNAPARRPNLVMTGPGR